MGKIEQVTVALPVEAAQALRRAVAGGEYPSEADALAAAVHFWADAHERCEIGDDVLAELWDRGIASGPGNFGSIDAILVEAETRATNHKA